MTVTVRQIRKLPAEWQAISGFVDEEAEEKVPKQSFAISFALPRAGAEGKQFDASVTGSSRTRRSSPGSETARPRPRRTQMPRREMRRREKPRMRRPPRRDAQCLILSARRHFLARRRAPRCLTSPTRRRASAPRRPHVEPRRRVRGRREEEKISAEPAETATEVTDAVADVEASETCMRAGCTKIVVECPLRWVKPESKATAADSAEEGQADAKEDGEEGETAGGESAEGEDIADEEEKAAESPQIRMAPVGTYIVVEVSLAQPLVATEDEETKTLTDVVVAASPPIPTYPSPLGRRSDSKVQEAVGDARRPVQVVAGAIPRAGAGVTPRDRVVLVGSSGRSSSTLSTPQVRTWTSKNV